MSTAPARYLPSSSTAGSAPVDVRAVITSRWLVGIGILAALTGLLGGQVLAPLGVALLLGLPHGAVDHVVLARRLGGLRGTLVGTGAYALLAVTVLGAAVVAPQVIWPLFLLLSVWHFGTADAGAPGWLDGSHRWVHALAAGLLPVGGLLVRGASDLRPLAAELSPRIVFLLDPVVVLGVGLATAVALIAALAAGVRAQRWDAVVDLLLIAVLFAVAPPLWAFGIYFGVWHAPRHIARMIVEESPFAAITRAEGVGAALRRFARAAAAPTAAALVAVGALLAVGPSADGVRTTALLLHVTAAVTFPHVMAVAYLDRRVAVGR